ncbi:hypothetical protein BH11ARM1_BH11ARM1_05310 [soil metagenome]
MPLKSQSVADFYEALRAELKAMGIEVKIWPVPVEIQDPIPFPKDTFTTRTYRLTPKPTGMRSSA